MIKKLFFPFYRITKFEKSIILIIEILFLLCFLEFFHFTFFPKPSAVLSELSGLLISPVFYLNLTATFIFLIAGFVISILLTLLLTYAYTMNIFNPFISFVSLCRYIPFNCVILFFVGGDIEKTKYYLLLFGLVPYFTASYLSIVKKTIDEGKEINKSLINRQNFFETLYEVIIVGKIDYVFEVIDLNFAIAWTLLTTIEGLAFNSGGLGTLIITGQKHLRMELITAYALIILLSGIGIGYVLKWFKSILIKY